MTMEEKLTLKKQISKSLKAAKYHLRMNKRQMELNTANLLGFRLYHMEELENGKFKYTHFTTEEINQKVKYHLGNVKEILADFPVQVTYEIKKEYNFNYLIIRLNY